VQGLALGGGGSDSRVIRCENIPSRGSSRGDDGKREIEVHLVLIRVVYILHSCVH